MKNAAEITKVFGTQDGWLCVQDESGDEYYLIPVGYYQKRNGNESVLFAEAQIKEWVSLGEFIAMGEE